MSGARQIGLGRSLPAFLGSSSDRLIAGLVVGAVIAFVCVVLKQSFADTFPFDFAYFHAAGRAWAAEVDPYGPRYAEFALPYIPNDAALWVYPPQWWSITVALGALPIGPAVLVWKALSFIALMVGGALLFDVLGDRTRKTWLPTAVLFAFVLASSDTAWVNLKLGQSSLFALLGAALVLHGLRFQGENRTTLGFFLLFLKPQFGLFMLLLLAGERQARRPILLALAASLVACLPILATTGLTATLESAQNFLGSMASYDDQPWNRPGSLTGVAFILAAAGLPSVPAAATIVLAWVTALILFRVAAHHGTVLDIVDRFLIGVAAFLAIVPLHTYDLTLLPVFLLLAPRLKAWASLLVAASIFMAWRMASYAFAIYEEQASSWLPGVYAAALAQAAVGTVAALLVLIAIVFGRRDPSHDAGPVRLP
jgi:hypothetical protein